MARFITRLIGSDTIADHDIRTISNGSAKRDGLIASRSAVSTDMYADLEAAYRSGGEGTYFPPDTFVITNNILTGSAYTASLTNPAVAGIRTPASYATRPTASITSSQTVFVGPSATKDSASVNYTTYLSASNGVKTVLDSVTGGGPYGRLGQNPSRTLHSIYHDPTLSYFAWDDFSPGTASATTGYSISPLVEIVGPGSNNGPPGFYTFITSSTPSVTITATWGTEYFADTLGTAYLTLDSNYAGTPGGSAINGDIDFTSVTPSPAGTSYAWVITDMTKFNRATGSIDVGVSFTLGRTPAVTASIFFGDVSIPSHFGSTVTTRTPFSSKVVKLVTLTGSRLFAALEGNGDAGPCVGVTTPVYAVFNDGVSAVLGDTPAGGNNTPNFIKLYSDIGTPTRFRPPGVTDGQTFWFALANSATIQSTDTMCEYDGTTGERTATACITNACGT